MGKECAILARVSMSGPMSSSLLLTLSVRRKQCKEFVFLLPAGREFSCSSCSQHSEHVGSSAGVHLDCHEDAVSRLIIINNIDWDN